MNVHVYIKEYRSNNEVMWKFRCVVFDNEALGVLERMLTTAGIEYKVNKEPCKLVN